MRHYFLLFILSIVFAPAGLLAQKKQHTDKFEQLGPAMLPTPNVYRAGSGAPGHQYWQHRADY